MDDNIFYFRYFKNNMKRIKHFLGWLFRYCPYGGHCAPEHPFKVNGGGKLDPNKHSFGGGC